MNEKSVEMRRYIMTTDIDIHRKVSEDRLEIGSIERSFDGTSTSEISRKHIGTIEWSMTKDDDPRNIGSREVMTNDDEVISNRLAFALSKS
jgi:hypothetical protein